ncbi:MAG: M48 family metallopeptidase [Bacteroidetes bacterium]|nr:M48 family metallopeptidase [Bacteroidota bacterium]
MDIEPKYHVERRRVRYARISVDHELNVKIVIPMRYTRAHLDVLLEEKKRWIAKQVAHFVLARERAVKLGQDELLYFGEPFRVDFDATNAKLAEAWYRDRAKEHVFTRVAELAGQFGYAYNRLFIRGSKTRWGSCSRQKNLSFNWRLMKTPPHVVDYLILHELAHTVHFNHSKRFWARVEATCPDYRLAERWLKENGSALH